MIFFLTVLICTSAVSAVDIQDIDNMTSSLFSYDNPSLELAQAGSNGVTLDESQISLDSNIKSENVLSQDSSAVEKELTIDGSNSQLVDMGSSGSSELRASLNTYPAHDEKDAAVLGSSVESLDVLSEDEGTSNEALTATDDKKDTEISADNIVGTPAETINVYAIVTDSDGNAVSSGTAVFTTNGQTYYAKVKDGLAIFYNVELPMQDSDDEMSFLEDDNYRSSSIVIHITIEADSDPGDDDSTPDVIRNDTTPSNYSADLKKGPTSNLGKYATANPILALFVALIAIVGSGVRFRK